MKVVSFICTFHDERGRTNVSELHAILERIHPEVIFLEAPFTLRRDQFEIGKLNNLESGAVSRYLDGHSVELVPVDLPTPRESFFRQSQELFNDVERARYEYCRLIDENKVRMIYEGFFYLNSESHSKHQSNLHEEILRTIESRDCKWMAEAYKEWRHVIELRDMEMLSNIAGYCRENAFGRAAFLVGAAHRESIVNRSRSLALSGAEGVQWDYVGNWYE